MIVTSTIAQPVMLRRDDFTMAEKPQERYWRFVLRRLVQYEAMILVVVAVLCVVAGWSAPDEIALAMLIVGVLVFSIGPFSMMGGWNSTRRWDYQYVQSMTGERPDERIKSQQADISQNMGLLLPSVVLGSLTIALSLLVQMLFNV